MSLRMQQQMQAPTSQQHGNTMSNDTQIDTIGKLEKTENNTSSTDYNRRTALSGSGQRPAPIVTSGAPLGRTPVADGPPASAMLNRRKSNAWSSRDTIGPAIGTAQGQVMMMQNIMRKQSLVMGTPIALPNRRMSIRTPVFDAVDENPDALSRSMRASVSQPRSPIDRRASTTRPTPIDRRRKSIFVKSSAEEIDAELINIFLTTRGVTGDDIDAALKVLNRDGDYVTAANVRAFVTSMFGSNPPPIVEKLITGWKEEISREDLSQMLLNRSNVLPPWDDAFEWFYETGAGVPNVGARSPVNSAGPLGRNANNAGGNSAKARPTSGSGKGNIGSNNKNAANAAPKTLDRAGIVRLVRKIAPNGMPGKRDVDLLLARYDRDRDGRLGLEDFKRMLL